MSEEPLNAGMKYAMDLLDTWREIRKLAEQYREAEIVYGTVPPQLRDIYVAKLTRFWVELSTKIIGRTEFKNFPSEFAAFEKYYKAPKSLNNSEEIYKMEACIREALEHLKITKFER